MKQIKKAFNNHPKFALNLVFIYIVNIVFLILSLFTEAYSDELAIVTLILLLITTWISFDIFNRKNEFDLKLWKQMAKATLFIYFFTLLNVFIIVYQLLVSTRVVR